MNRTIDRTCYSDGFVVALQIPQPQGQVNLKKLSVVSCLDLNRLYPAEFNQSWLGSVYVVNRCAVRNSTEYSDSLNSLCLMGSQAGSDSFLRLPVYSRRTLAFYLNFYCAACNGETDIQYLKVEKKCQSKVSFVSVLSRLL